MTGQKQKVLLLGASGRIGRPIMGEGLRRGLRFTAVTRRPGEVGADGERVRVVQGDPRDAGVHLRTLPGHDAVVIALGIDVLRPTRLLSGTIRALVPAMRASGVGRLIAITGADDTGGRGGSLYDRLISPLFTADRHADEAEAEKLVESSGLRWTVVRPARLGRGSAKGPLGTATEVRDGIGLARIDPDEVARFVVDELETGVFVGRKPVVGHRN